MSTLQPGSMVGPYEIVAPLGAGGMGEVYRAKDARLGREVAIKVLPEQFSSDPERLRRFEQEARAAGILNHPNILTVYDVGVQDGFPYVVSELLVGETLRERLGGSSIGTRKAIEYSLQIANGLAAAHDKGIVHRDLKPENIFLTRDGRVKLLDFGLAKLTIPEPISGGRSSLATIDPATQPGVVMGTVGYMSPEQVRGREVDHRSDIFSFGTILYEMITGKRAFHRDTTADTMSAILKEDPPDPSSLNKSVSSGLERILRHCMEKNPEERFQSARDLAFDLEMVSGATGVSSQVTSRVAPRSFAPWKTILLAITLLLIAGIGIALLLQKQSGKNASLSIQRLTFRRGFVTGARFAPDSQSILYSATWSGSPVEIFTTRPQSPVSKSLSLPTADVLSVSSSGEMAILLNPRFTLGWQRTGTLARVPIDGGAPREIVEDVQDAAWTPDGKDLAVVRNTPAKRRLEFPIGKIIFETEGWLSNLRFSPDGKSIAAFEHSTTGDDRGVVVVFDLNGEKKVLSQEWSSASGMAWSPDSKEIWFTASSLGSNQNSIQAVTTSGKSRIVFATAGNVLLHDLTSEGDVLLAKDDRRREMIGLPAGETVERDLSWFDWSFPRDITEDGRFVLFEEQGAGGGHNYSVYVRALDGSAAIQIGEGYAGRFSPDGKWATAVLPTITNQATLLPIGAGQTKPITFSRLNRINNVSWLPDSKSLLVSGTEKGHGLRIWAYKIESGDMRPITPEGISSPFPQTSNDGNYVLGRCLDSGLCHYPISGGEPKKLLGLQDDDIVMGYTADGNSVYAGRRGLFPLDVEIVNVVTGERKPWKRIVPPDLAGTVTPINMLIIPDGSAYVYTYRRVLSDLYLVKGLK